MLEGFVPYPGEFVDRYRSRGLRLDRSLWELFAQKCQAFADRPAIVYAGTTPTYHELEERSVGWRARCRQRWGSEPWMSRPAAAERSRADRRLFRAPAVGRDPDHGAASTLIVAGRKKNLIARGAVFGSSLCVRLIAAGRWVRSTTAWAV